jgi:hypothetical protein
MRHGAAATQAESLLAAHDPVPQWALEGVLLSSDLMPHVLAPLELEDGAAAAASACCRRAQKCSKLLETARNRSNLA